MKKTERENSSVLTSKLNIYTRYIQCPKDIATFHLYYIQTPVFSFIFIPNPCSIRIYPIQWRHVDNKEANGESFVVVLWGNGNFACKKSNSVKQSFFLVETDRLLLINCFRLLSPNLQPRNRVFQPLDFIVRGIMDGRDLAVFPLHDVHVSLWCSIKASLSFRRGKALIFHTF